MDVRLLLLASSAASAARARHFCTRTAATVAAAGWQQPACGGAGDDPRVGPAAPGTHNQRQPKQDNDDNEERQHTDAQASELPGKLEPRQAGASAGASKAASNDDDDDDDDGRAASSAPPAAADPHLDIQQAHVQKGGCEGEGAATRDLLLSRLAALEAEVAAMQQAGGTAGKPQSDRRRRGDAGGRAGRHAQQAGKGEEGRAAAARGEAKEKEEEEQEGAGASGGAVGGTADAMAEGLSKLHPRVMKLVQSGYMESLHHLRQRMLVDEWEGGGRQRALRRGVADFEAACADKGIDVGWQVLSKLYQDPGRGLESIPDERTRSLARSTLARVLDERYESTREGATKLAKELADGVAKGPSNVLGWLGGLLPVPGFLKGFLAGGK